MRLACLVVTLALFYSCSPISKGKLNKTFRSTERRFQHHTGFVLYDLQKNKTVFDFNGSRYFTPASNTKILTFFAALKTLGDSVPALEYIQRNDSLIFWGTGDPSFLYKEVFYDSGVYHFLRSIEADLYFSDANFHTTHFGPGWAWDDYSSGYSAERSPFPVYGNIVSVIADQQVLRISPDYFSGSFIHGEQKDRIEIIRDLDKNLFTVHPPKKIIAEVREINIPIKLDSSTFYSLLADTLKRPVVPVHKALPPYTNTLFSVHLDSLYSVMMQESDNFIAEQLLLMCANVLSDSLKPEIAIDFIIENYLRDLPDEPVWVDGSGLSRYNLFTPRSIVKLWQKIWEIVPQERLFSLLATGGVKGTIRKWYHAEKPYIFGKTGSLSNNHCLSGFLITKKGKVLIFSFMNSNYTRSTNDIRRNMQKILFNIYENY
jgi:D-alanyl-D-alanine carboxypeptidase/D-alanyl-D-alanine-endopeptidase (penicillin-binding protein 4)